MEFQNFIKCFKESKAAVKPKYPQSVEDVYNAFKMITDEDMKAALTLSEKQLKDEADVLIGCFCEVQFPDYSAVDEIFGLYMRERVIMRRITQLRRAVLEHLAFVDEHFTPQGK